jgi:hypothetical protein
MKSLECESTSRGFPGPSDVHERYRQSVETHIIVKLTKHERECLRPDRHGVLGRFCLLDNLDGTYELVKYADD